MTTAPISRELALLQKQLARVTRPAEVTWRRFEQTLARRERGRLIRLGHIKMKSQPIVMEKNNEGNWRLPTLARRL
jgi:hypothetical protein